MNTRSLAVLACRILAIVALISALQSTVYLFPSLYEAAQGYSLDFIGFRPNPWEILLTQGAPFLLLLLLSSVLWFRAEWLAARMTSAHDAGFRPDILVNPQVQALAFACVGLYSLIAALARAANLMVIFVASGLRDPIMRNDALDVSISEFAIVVAQFALGMWLFAGAGRLVRGFDYLRRAGRDIELQSEENGAPEIPIRPEK